MSEQKSKSRKEELDEFWDLSKLVPRKRAPHAAEARDVRTVSIDLGAERAADAETTSGSSFTFSGEGAPFTRFIPPHSASEEREKPTPLRVITYENALIHRVSVYPWRSDYRYYEEFLHDARSYFGQAGQPCPYVPFFSYVPQFHQLNRDQLSYYLYFRFEALGGKEVQADVSYVLLFVYELINLSEEYGDETTLSTLVFLWNTYASSMPKLEHSLLEWICDFCLLHGILPPVSLRVGHAISACTLKEMFVSSANRDAGGYAKALLSFCSSYDYHSSKFAKDDALPLFETHIPMALSRCLDTLSEDGQLLSRLNLEDCTLHRDAYAGALCSYRIRCRMEIEYCSFSRTNELRYIVGDIVRYSENKLRAMLGIKSRLSTYSLPTDLREVLDRYFADVTSGMSRPRRTEQKREAYEALYDTEHKPLSLTDARQIEEASWETTRSLVEAFEDEEASQEIKESGQDREENRTSQSTLAPYMPYLRAVRDGEKDAVRQQLAAFGMMEESLVDKVNTVATELFDDILLEYEDGQYRIIEDYLDYITEE